MRKLLIFWIKLKIFRLILAENLPRYYLRLHNIVAAPISQDWLGILKIGLDVQKGLELS